MSSESSVSPTILTSEFSITAAATLATCVTNSIINCTSLFSSWKYFANAANVNAFYWSQANSIVIPAGILRDIFFDHDRPQYLNFGTIGYVIGHEITHGFDNIGAQFDDIGNARNWWKNETKKHYNEKAQCMIKQYKDYELPTGLRINGDLTLKENIADNGAIKEAYQAYEKYVRKFGEEAPLPGLKYSPKQLFWIAAAMVSAQS